MKSRSCRREYLSLTVTALLIGCFVLTLAGCSSMQPSVQAAATGSHAEHASGRFVLWARCPSTAGELDPTAR
jgi:hypothetical protein